MKIGLLSDTHGHMDQAILEFLQPCDEIWHAGDVGPMDNVVEPLLTLGKPFRGVYGNIDDHVCRAELPEIAEWEILGVKFLMIHIGGKPPRYAKGVKELIQQKRPDVFICGHSHILKVQMDKALKCLYINPGAAGKYGFHKVRTLLRFDIGADARLKNMEVVELHGR